MRLSNFDYDLPPELVAQDPAPERDASRMLILERCSGTWEDQWFLKLPELLRGDELLVVNNAQVIPARLVGRRLGIQAGRAGRRGARGFLSSGIEVLLVRQVGVERWEALVKPGRKVRVGERIIFGGGELQAEVVGRGSYGLREVRLWADGGTVSDAVNKLGHVPLPPYIHRADSEADRERYQTIFASEPGAIAAPTAGLHFTSRIVDRLRARGVELCEINLQVGLATFQPLHGEEIEEHRMAAESYEIPPAAHDRIMDARRRKRPIVAVGTTVVRALEDAAEKVSGRESCLESRIAPGRGEATIFICPGHTFRVVDQLLTNFHLPKSSLLILVSAFAGRELLLRAYQHAVQQCYRFYSYGDCMLIR